MNKFNIVSYAQKKQSEIIKQYSGIERLVWGADEENFFYTIDNTTAYVIPRTLLLLNLDKISEKYSKNESLKAIVFTPDDEYTAAAVTSYIPHKAITLAAVESENARVFVDQKCFKEFDSPDFTVTVKSATSPVKVFWCETLVAVIMPVRI